MKCPCARKRNGWRPSKRRSKTVTLGAWLAEGINKLANSGEHISALHAITESVIQHQAAWQISNPQFPLTDRQAADLQKKLECLLIGTPLAYITGKKAFYGRDFFVNENVLIPRPETELLVDHAIAVSQQTAPPTRIADVGTGSGCIAISLASAIPQCAILATDISFAALALAKNNAQQLDALEKIHFVQVNLLDGIDCSFDIICANLPYIPRRALEKLDVNQHEPSLALDGGEDGLALIKQLLSKMRKNTRPGTIALFEIEAPQGTAFTRLCKAFYPQASIKIIRDLAGHDRLGIIHL